MAVINFIFSAVRIAMAFLLGSTGETLTEKSGHLNLGIPGIMCVGAAGGCVAEALYTRAAVAGKTEAPAEYGQYISPFLAVVIPIFAAFLCAALMGLLYSFLTVTLRANQNVSGLALTTLGIGVADYMISTVRPAEFGHASKYFTAYLPFADSLGGFGKLFFSYGVMVYLSVFITLAVSYVLFKTSVGLRLRSVGEDPATADAAGISVTKYRYIATLVGSGIAGLGGLTYVMDTLNGNWEYVIDAIGWLSIALVIFTVWKPHLGIPGSILFGALYIAGSYISGVSTANKSLIKMLPYAVTVIVLIITGVRRKKENRPPQGLGVNYFREER